MGAITELVWYSFLPTVKSVRDRPSYFAQKLYKSMKGAGTDEQTLTRVMVTRSEIDMVQIKQRFQEHYGKTLASFIKVQYYTSNIEVYGYLLPRAHAQGVK